MSQNSKSLHSRFCQLPEIDSISSISSNMEIVKELINECTYILTNLKNTNKSELGYLDKNEIYFKTKNKLDKLYVLKNYINRETLREKRDKYKEKLKNKEIFLKNIEQKLDSKKIYLYANTSRMSDSKYDKIILECNSISDKIKDVKREIYKLDSDISDIVSKLNSWV